MVRRPTEGEIVSEIVSEIKTIAIGRLYFNKGLPQYEDSLMRCIYAMYDSGMTERMHIITRDGQAVDKARNTIVRQAMDHKADAIVWLDTDMIYPDDAIVRLVLMAQKYPIAAGLYRRTRPNYDLLAEIDNESATVEQLLEMRNEDGVTPVSMVAGGFSIVRRHVYEEMLAKIGMPWYCNWDFRSKHGQTGEDRFFVLRAAEIGYQPVVDPELHAVHCGRSYVPVVEDQPEMRFAR